MKKLFSALCLIIFSISLASAQKMQYGIKAGLGFASQSISDPNVVSKNSLLTFNIYAVADRALKSNFYLQAGIGVTGKGVKEYQDAETNTVTITYVDIPVNLLYKVPLPTLGKVYFGAGPYFSYAIGGNNQNETPNITSGQNLEFGSNKDYKKADYGANFAAGLELNNHLTFNLNYALGIENISAEQTIIDASTNTKNRIFTIGLGFLF